MSIRYPVMVFSFENVPTKQGVCAGLVSHEDVVLATQNVEQCVYDTLLDLVGEDHPHGDLYANTFARLATTYLRRFSEEDMGGFRKSVTLSTECPWSLHVGVVNSDDEYMSYCAEVSVKILPTGNETPEEVDIDTSAVERYSEKVVRSVLEEMETCLAGPFFLSKEGRLVDFLPSPCMTEPEQKLYALVRLYNLRKQVNSAWNELCRTDEKIANFVAQVPFEEAQYGRSNQDSAGE
jgi:hypothetical protein